MKKHELPKLPYELDALEPQISRETMEYHYGKHHKAYVDKLNELTPETKFEEMTLDEIVRTADGAIFNQAAQVWNHTFFFFGLSPKPQTAPVGELAAAIERDFGSFAKLKEDFAKAGVGQFGSGWAWLVVDKAGKLAITTTSNAGNPMTDGKTPIMCIDVWEHAYYIDYRNRRPDFIAGAWDRLDWATVGERFAKAQANK
ncbi:superoxide dismutase [Alistipes sp. OttesenSCG-928-B03]|nr:superoxide dismutase [Alistipes sp. OttesenSCG-928-B03]